MTKKKPILDPEWNPLARIGEIKSRVNLALDEATTLVAEIEAKGVLAQRQNVRVLKRGTIELRELAGCYVAIFDPEARTLEVNGRTVPSRPAGIRTEAQDPRGALVALSNEIAKSL